MPFNDAPSGTGTMALFKLRLSATPSPNSRQPAAQDSGLGDDGAIAPVPANTASPAQPIPLLQRLGQSLLAQLGQSLGQVLLRDDQPQVTWWRDAQGHDHYRVYDPISQQQHNFETAQGVRVWLEQRYYLKR